MAENKENDMKIPVFTVIKNGAILKNIFVLNKPPPPSPLPSISGPQSITAVENEEDPVEDNDEEEEEILIVGRHPDCHIMLTHPSISRFHLQIHSKPSSQNLSVIDLSSVHGTWVSGEKIEPCVPVELKEGDTIKIGGSTRIYRLHWIPLSQAYDMDNPFVSPLDVPVAEEKEEENEVETHQVEKSESIKDGKSEVRNSLAVEPKEEQNGVNSLSIEEFNHVEGKDSLVLEEKEELCQDEISASVHNKAIQSLDWVLEGIVSLFCDEGSELIPETDIPSFGSESTDLSCSIGGNISAPEEQQFDKDLIPKSFLTRSERKTKFLEDLVTSPSNAKSPLQESEMRNNLEVWSEPFMKESGNSAMVSGGVLSEIKTEQVDKENQTLPSLIVMQPPEGETKEKSSVDEYLNLSMALNSACSTGEGCPAAEMFEAENHGLAREGHEQKEIVSFCSALLEAESVNSSLLIGEVLSEIADNKNCQTPESTFFPEGFEDKENSEVSPIRSDKRPGSHSIWSRRGKPASVLQIQTGRSRGKSINAKVEMHKQEDTENKSISKKLFSGFEEREEEIFTPNKENLSPDTLLLKSLKRKGKLEDTKHSRSCRKSFSKVTVGPNVQPEEDLAFSSDKENQTPKVLQEKKLARHSSRNQVKLEQDRVVMKKRAERMPFQSLVSNSPDQRRSEVSLSNASTRSSNSVNFTQTMKKVSNSSSAGEPRRSWTMVVDATTLLDKESRKSLQLLQGLKGTQLIIPRMVIRELDCLKRRGSLFRRTTEVSSLLEWIEECMVKTKWWIHIQSSVEEGRPIAPTPPASPKSLFSEGSSGSLPCGTKSWGVFSSPTSLTEIVSPTAEDHILDCALLSRKMKGDRQLVLLSNDVTLKIKAMAEGLICETAQEFRESLVNPFSERFLWADSSPRGLTWSVLDDVVLREKYSRGPLKKTSKGGDGAKGLKLILLHNSQYAQMGPVR